MNLFSPSAPKAPPVPKAEDIRTEDLQRRVNETTALRDALSERRALLAARGRQSLVNPGLGIPA